MDLHSPGGQRKRNAARPDPELEGRALTREAGEELRGLSVPLALARAYP